MLHRLQVEGYKSLDGVDVVLEPLTVVFGPNAADKSNLLDAIGLLSRMATSPNLDAAFASHRGTPRGLPVPRGRPTGPGATRPDR